LMKFPLLDLFRVKNKSKQISFAALFSSWGGEDAREKIESLFYFIVARAEGISSRINAQMDCAFVLGNCAFVQGWGEGIETLFLHRSS
jgi:hypothetical protein